MWSLYIRNRAYELLTFHPSARLHHGWVFLSLPQTWHHARAYLSSAYTLCKELMKLVKEWWQPGHWHTSERWCPNTPSASHMFTMHSHHLATLPDAATSVVTLHVHVEFVTDKSSFYHVQGMETSEDARERADKALAAGRRLTALWERRARSMGWKDNKEGPFRIPVDDPLDSGVSSGGRS